MACRPPFVKPDRQVRYRDATEFFSPTFRRNVSRSLDARVYSFRAETVDLPTRQAPDRVAPAAGTGQPTRG